MPQLVPMAEFIVSPGFAGAAAVVGAVIVLCAVLYGVRRSGKRFNQELEQRDRHHQEARHDEQHAVEVARSWETLKWLVETAGIEPAASEGATLGLGPELAVELVWGLLRDAERLGDETLASAVVVYQNQFALVLAQQGGPLSELAAATSAVSGDGKPGTEPARSTPEEPEKQSATAADEAPAGTAEVAVGGRRRRR